MARSVRSRSRRGSTLIPTVENDDDEDNDEDTVYERRNLDRFGCLGGGPDGWDM